jgi:hypothetical protein
MPKNNPIYEKYSLLSQPFRVIYVITEGAKDHRVSQKRRLEMKISYNRTGKERKALVAALAEATGAEVKYLGAPTFAYEVGKYVIDKEGTLTGRANKKLVAALAGRGFTGADNEAEAYAEREMRRMRLEAENVPDHPASGPYGGDDIPEPEASADGDLLTIEMSLDGFTDEAIENLELLVASKATLIKNAIGSEELPIERTEGILRFPWFRGELAAEEASAYSLFIGALCAAAKEAKRVTAKDKPVENEKFAFRVFLIRLGCVGDEYKQARRILLMNLPGNSAFKGGRPDKDGGGRNE